MSDSKQWKYRLVLFITVARIPFAAIFAIVLLYYRPTENIQYNILNYKWFAMTCAFLMILGEVTDFIDGMLARKLGVVSEAGAMLDPYADSIARIIVFWALATAGLVTMLVPFVMVFRDITVAYCRIVLGKSGKSVSAKWSGKIKACVQGYGSVALFYQPYFWAWFAVLHSKWSINIGSGIIIAVTLASMVEYVKSAYKEAGALGYKDS